MFYSQRTDLSKLNLLSSPSFFRHRNTLQTISRLALLALTLPLGATANDDFLAGDGGLSSQYMPHIPEPMVFDLVRPLGARKGELEVNSLFEHGLRRGGMEWAPEIEYAFADGYAIEFELPAEGSQLLEYKLALQGTFGTLMDNRMIHGWQVIGIQHRETHGFSGDFLYLNGMELGQGWSTFNMVGMRRNDHRLEGNYQAIINNSIFYSLNDRVTLGLEVNNEVDNVRWATKIIPQLHYDLSENWIMQMGAGPSWLERSSTNWTLDWRLIYAY